MKVQLEHQEDLQRIQKTIESHSADLLSTLQLHDTVEREATRRYIKRILNQVFQTTSLNVQVKGSDWNEAHPETEQLEPFNETLHQELHRLRLEVDNLLVEVSRKRKEYPEQITLSLIQKSPVESLSQAPHAVQPMSSKSDVSFDSSERLDVKLRELIVPSTQSYHSSSEAMHRLKLHVPQLISKFKDIHEVLLDRRKLDSYDSEMNLVDN